MLVAQSLDADQVARCAASRTRTTSITALYREFETMHAKVKVAQQRLDAATGTPQSVRLDREFSRICARCHEIAQQLEAAPAKSVHEILLKLRATAWANVEVEYRTLEELDHKMPACVEESNAGRVLASIQADLLRLTEAH